MELQELYSLMDRFAASGLTALEWEREGERVALREARKHCGWYMAGIRGAAALRRQAGTISAMEDVRALARAAILANAGDGEKPSTTEE